ncbi:MAG: hypothetical protein MNPFHGCM_02957 [Gemmatimonadaceae bacterium]|nr:hypothetical protein [Gemmatimonadaceae bacterium]
MANGETTNINILSWPKEPATVNQATDSTIAVRGQVPICIRVCEPICARSEYAIGITIFDRPVATITVSGETRLFNCDEKR